MEKLFEIQHIVLEQFEKHPFYDRTIFQQMSMDNQINGIVGARGIGKTTFLLNKALQHGAKQRKALYVSADNLFFLENKLIDLTDYLYKKTDAELLCIDEIHKYPNWEQELKNISDIYPSIKIIFSGSSMIDLMEGKYDLSRRVSLYHLYGFSFREYLEFYLGKKFPLISLEELIQSHLEFAQSIEVSKILKHFEEYLTIGYYPFFTSFTRQQDKFQTLNNSVQMTIYEDFATLHTLKTPSLLIIEKLFKYIINSSPGEVSAGKLARLLRKDFETISNYLHYLEQAGLIRFIYPNNGGGAFIRNPIKMYPENVNLIHAAYLPLTDDLAKGKMRETFIVNQIQNANIPIFYSKHGDFKVGDYIFEIGGKNKSSKQLQGARNGLVISDDILIGSKHCIPLYLFGFLY